MNSYKLFQPSPYKNFDDYIEFHSINSSNTQFTAKEKNPTRTPDKCYEERWYILLRAGLYRAEVEKALSEIYRYFLGFATDIEIVKKGNDFYAASRGIANYQTWLDCLSRLILSPKGQLLIKDQDRLKPIIGLGKISALTRFFADDDPAPGNFGLQFLENEPTVRAFKIDSEKGLALDDDELNESLEKEIQFTTNCFLKCDLTQTDWFKQEKQEILEVIAKTDFSIIEKILRKNITSNYFETILWIVEHMEDPQEKEKILSKLREEEKELREKYSTDALIDKLREKHNKLCQEINNLRSCERLNAYT